MAPDHPGWKETEPFKSVLTGDHAAMAKFTEKDWMEIVAVTHAGVSSTDFEAIVADWLPKSKSPAFGRPVTDLTYQPMLEVMDYLRANGFRTYIVTGGGQELDRVYSEDVYGVPANRSWAPASSPTTNEERQPGADARPKPLFITTVRQGHWHRPVHRQAPAIAFGNSNGDREMLGMDHPPARTTLGLLVLHDDAEREFAYGPDNGLPAEDRRLQPIADGRSHGRKAERQSA